MAEDYGPMREGGAPGVYHTPAGPTPGHRRPSAPAGAALAAALLVAGSAAAREPLLQAVVHGTQPDPAAPLVVLCGDPWDRPEILTARDGGGLAGALTDAGFRVALVDPWSTPAARERGFDGVVADVFPAIVEEAAARGRFAFVGFGVCGLLPVAAAARSGNGDPRYLWAAVGSPFDPRTFGGSVLEWLGAFAVGEPLPGTSVAVLCTGLRDALGARPDSLPPSMAGAGPAGQRLELWHRDGWMRPPPGGVLSDLLRWAQSGRFGDRAGWLDYGRGFGLATGPAFLLAGASDPLAPPEAVLLAARGLAASPEVIVAGRASGAADDLGHLGLMVSRAAAGSVDAPLGAWLRRVLR